MAYFLEARGGNTCIYSCTLHSCPRAAGTAYEPIKSIKSNQIKSNQIKSNQIKSNQIKSNQIKSNQIKSNQINR
jgi:hypothetical protein